MCRSTWNTTSLVCHNLTSHLSSDCLVAIAPDNTLKCCPHEERIKCEQEGFLTTFSVTFSKSTCRRRFVFDEYRGRCVRLYRSARRTTKTTTTQKITTMSTTTVEATTLYPVNYSDAGNTTKMQMLRNKPIWN